MAMGSYTIHRLSVKNLNCHNLAYQTFMKRLESKGGDVHTEVLQITLHMGSDDN